MKFALLILTLNEIEGLQEILPQINEEWVDEVLIVDGGSTDGTKEFVLEHGYELYVQKRPGLRHAYIEAMPHVKSDCVIVFSPDGNSMPEKIPEVVKAMQQGCDMVICSRYLDDAKSYDDDPITKFGNWLFTKLINIIHNGCYTDSMVMYRGIKKSVFMKLGLNSDEPFRLPERWFRTELCLMPLLSIRAARMKIKVKEIPADEPKRIGGERKLKIVRWGLSYLYQTLAEACIKYEKNDRRDSKSS